MQYAPIVPPQLSEVLLDAPTNYHFALGQKLVWDSEYYGALYSMLKQRGAFIIVDNGAAETDDQLVSFDEIVRATIAFDGADEYILPDVLRDKEATIQATCDPDVRMQVTPKKRMIVPQGRNWVEWLDCLFEIDQCLQGYYATIGVAKHLESLPGGRMQAMELITKNDFHKRHKIHLLGAYRNLVTEALTIEEHYPGVVRGIDSGEPIAHAQHGLVSEKHTPHKSLDWNLSADTRVARINVQRACQLIGLTRVQD